MKSAIFELTCATLACKETNFYSTRVVSMPSHHSEKVDRCKCLDLERLW